VTTPPTTILFTVPDISKSRVVSVVVTSSPVENVPVREFASMFSSAIWSAPSLNLMTVAIRAVAPEVEPIIL